MQVETPAPPPEQSPTVSEPPSATGADRMVRPSEVSRDRVRTSTTKVQSELEKAREAFAKAEEVGIEEGSEGIIETRMLRASEVRELLESAAEYEAAAIATPPPAQPEVAQPGMEQPPAAPSMPTPKDLEEGILGAKSTLVDKPEPTPFAPPAPPEQMPAETLQPQTTPPSEPIASPPTTTPEPIPQAPPAPAPTPSTPVIEPPPEPTIPQIIPEVEVIEMKIPDTEYLNDEKISGALTELRHLHVELKQVEVELEGVCAHHEVEVQNYRNAAEVKRMRLESLEEQTRHAKVEWNAATKEYQGAEKRKKEEIQSREKRMDKIRKSISKAETTIERRVRVLEREGKK